MVGQDGRLRDEADPVFRPRFDIAITGASGPLDPSVERFTISLAYPLLYLRAALGRGENVHVVPLQGTATPPRFELDWRNHP
jgi:hypothetical protein